MAAALDRVSLPTGTVTFLFTDIEGSTNLARALGDRWPDVLHEHHLILRTAIRSHGGIDLSTEGDAFFAVFTSDPARFAVDEQALACMNAGSTLQAERSRGCNHRFRRADGPAGAIEGGVESVSGGVDLPPVVARYERAHQAVMPLHETTLVKSTVASTRSRITSSSRNSARNRLISSMIALPRRYQCNHGRSTKSCCTRRAPGIASAR
ncbi:MAG: hypothetical protein H0U86_00695 [Chloroflexi bacterium]|nr:hypothetical protein [Chloroflexota bacterium]